MDNKDINTNPNDGLINEDSEKNSVLAKESQIAPSSAPQLVESNQYLSQNQANALIIQRVSIVTLAANGVLTILKLVLGALFKNVSVLSDAIHSATDIFTTLLVLFAAAISKPQADKNHPYGHEKLEPLIVLFFSLILGATAVSLAIGGIGGLISPKNTTINYYLISITFLSIVAKEAMFHYTNHFAKKTRSNTLKADAWHHRSDALSSVAVLIGLIVSVLIKKDIGESVAVLLVAALILKISFDIFKSSVDQLIDRAADEGTIEELTKLVKSVEGVLSIDKMQTRIFGAGLYVDIEIGVCGDLTVYKSHEIAQKVHDLLENQEAIAVKHCNVHLNPANIE